MPNTYCFEAANKSTALEACKLAYDGLRAMGLTLYGDVPVGVLEAPTAVGQWGRCSPMGSVAWLSAAPSCPVPPLAPLTDPDVIRFENGERWRPDKLTPEFQQKLQCLANAITQAGGTYTPGSAWRPTEYQRHLKEIVTKDSQLNPAFMKDYPECGQLRADVTREMAKHALEPGQLVAEPGNSRHETGKAFDLTPDGLTETQLNNFASQCGLQHKALRSEPWHYQ